MKRFKRIVRKTAKCTGIVMLLLVVTILVISFISGLRVQAAGWIEEAANKTAAYSKYPLNRYTLDFYVNMSWDWLPWNWLDGIGKGASYAIYMLTNVFWMLGVYLSYFVGYLVEQAFNLDILSQISSKLATNVQKIAGVSSSGFRSHGLLPSFAPILIVLAGAYFFYLGIIKKQVAKAANSLLSFIVIFVLGMGVIAYSGDYLDLVNGFQKDFNKEVLTIGTLITSDGEGDPVHGMRDQLFDIMIKKPYLLLQYGTTDTEQIGTARIDNLLSTDPGSSGGERTDIVEGEVENLDNMNMSLSMLGLRLAMVLLTLVVNIVIAVCVALFAGSMILTQVMVVLYISFFPVALLFCLFPASRQSLGKYFNKLFEALMMKAGITLLLTIVFSISSLLYAITSGSNYFWIMFLQVVVFVGAKVRSQEFLGLMRIGSNDGQQIGRRMSNFSNILLNRMLGRRIAKSFIKSKKTPNQKSKADSSKSAQRQTGKKNFNARSDGDQRKQKLTDLQQKKQPEAAKAQAGAKKQLAARGQNINAPSARSGASAQAQKQPPTQKRPRVADEKRRYNSPPLSAAEFSGDKRPDTEAQKRQLENLKKTRARNNEDYKNRAPEMRLNGVSVQDGQSKQSAVRQSARRASERTQSQTQARTRTETERHVRRARTNTNNSIQVRRKKDVPAQGDWILNGKRGGTL